MLKQLVAKVKMTFDDFMGKKEKLQQTMVELDRWGKRITEMENVLERELGTCDQIGNMFKNLTTGGSGPDDPNGDTAMTNGMSPEEEAQLREDYESKKFTTPSKIPHGMLLAGILLQYKEANGLDDEGLFGYISGLGPVSSGVASVTLFKLQEFAKKHPEFFSQASIEKNLKVKIAMIDESESTNSEDGTSADVNDAEKTQGGGAVSSTASAKNNTTNKTNRSTWAAFWGRLCTPKLSEITPGSDLN